MLFTRQSEKFTSILKFNLCISDNIPECDLNSGARLLEIFMLTNTFSFSHVHYVPSERNTQLPILHCVL